MPSKEYVVFFVLLLQVINPWKGSISQKANVIFFPPKFTPSLKSIITVPLLSL